MPNLTSPETIKALLARHGVRPNKRRGQHFLINEEVLQDIVTAANLVPTDAVLEIGPGPGGLTTALAPLVKQVLAVELDAAMAKILAETTAGYPNVTIWRRDILDISNSELATALGGQYQVVANVPYLITNVLFRKFLSQLPQPTQLVFLIQKEVAERIVARPGDMSILALSVQLYGRPEIIRLVPAASFYPAPAVDSAVIAVRDIHPYQPPSAAAAVTEAHFWQTVKIGFAAPRKQLVNNLAAGFHQEKTTIIALLKQLMIDPHIRAEGLSVDEWFALAKNL
ncbi:MAG: 16S rRNA (adenine(1518)-N(6)/adenine(1519)-N(6))-dimethyltransferase RsmA [Patescibacteria group bacterium]